MRGSAPWWIGAGPAESAVACGPNRHRLRWEDGTLVAVDHPDPAAEALLAAMGGDEPACLQVVRRWKAHAGDPRVLVLAGRHPGDAVTVDPEDRAQARRALEERRDAGQAASRGHFRELMASTSRSPELPAGATESARWGPGRATAEQLEAHVALLELLSLDPSLQRRLQLEVAARLADVAAQPTDPGAPQAAAVLEAATVGRLVPVVRRWSEGGVVDVAIGTPAGVSVGARGAITVTVGVRWVADIWGRYLAAVGGFLVLEVHRIVEDRAEITGWASPAGDPARLLLRGPAPWRVVERLER